MSRGINYIKTIFSSVGRVGAFPKTGGSGGGNSNAAFTLLFHPIHNRLSFMHFADFMGYARVKQHTLGNSCFTGVDVGYDPEISGLFYGVLSGHSAMFNVETFYFL